MQKVRNENTLQYLLKKFQIIATKELACRGNEGAYCRIDYYKVETVKVLLEGLNTTPFFLKLQKEKKSS